MKAPRLYQNKNDYIIVSTERPGYLATQQAHWITGPDTRDFVAWLIIWVQFKEAYLGKWEVMIELCYWCTENIDTCLATDDQDG